MLKTPYVMTGTVALAELIGNAARCILKQGVPAEEIVIVAPDDETARSFAEIAPTCRIVVNHEDLPSEEQLYMEEQWSRIVKWKLKVLSDTLLHSDVFYIDPDVVVFDDIRKFVPDGNWDICVQQHERPIPCMGIVAARSTEFAREFLSPPAGWITSDDARIGAKWNLEDPRLRFLDKNMFPVGCLPMRRPPAVCYHYNYMIGMRKKIDRMRLHGNWIKG